MQINQEILKPKGSSTYGKWLAQREAWVEVVRITWKKSGENIKRIKMVWRTITFKEYLPGQQKGKTNWTAASWNLTSDN